MGVACASYALDTRQDAYDQRLLMFGGAAFSSDSWRFRRHAWAFYPQVITLDYTYSLTKRTHWTIFTIFTALTVLTAHTALAKLTVGCFAVLR